jgi:hypothetical protein
MEDNELVRTKVVEDAEDSGSDKVDACAHVLTKQVSKLSLDAAQPLIICDAGYGLPSQARPKREKISAISKQLYNFLEWQMDASGDKKKLARVQVVGSSDVISLLQVRLLKLWGSTTLPNHIEFSCQSLEECIATKEGGVYLSPDANQVLDPSNRPPTTVIVGLLIDRRIQPNRSMTRATSLEIPTARWPLEEFANVDSQEPLNVDTVMEGMQEWYWNCNDSNSNYKECFVHAATSAIERHAKRHPNRPLHKT